MKNEIISRNYVYVTIMFDLPDEIICYILLPYLIDDYALQEYLSLLNRKKRRKYLLRIAHSFIGRSVTFQSAKYFVNTFNGDINERMRNASKGGHLPIVQYLVEAKADIHALDDEALRWAAHNGHVSVVQYLVEAKADIHADNDRSLQWAAYRGHLAVVQYLVEAKADVHARNDLALQYAALKGHLPIVQYLVEAKADIHTDNDCALQWAAGSGHSQIVHYLQSLYT